MYFDPITKVRRVDNLLFDFPAIVVYFLIEFIDNSAMQSTVRPGQVF